MSRSVTFVVLAVVVLLVVVGGTWYWTQVRHGEGAAVAAAQWICPMHPQVIQDRPGTCPICNMDLVPASEGDGGDEGNDADHAGHDAPPAVEKWICPMHPQVIQDRPGSCPICNMDLVPSGGVDEPVVAAGNAQPEGLVSIRPSATLARRIGARSELVTRAPFHREIRATARVAVDETRLRLVHTKTAGWVERLWADAVGRTVQAGEPLLEIYSPELLAAQQEFKVALGARDRLAPSKDAEVAALGNGIVAAARRRLALLDVAADDIARLEAGGEVRRNVVVTSPIAGTILERNVAQGARIEPGTELLTVADLSRVWVVASIYEYELPFVREGQEALLTLPYLPQREYRGRVSFVYPTLDPVTRTISVRLEFDNPGFELKPEMYGEVRLQADLGPRLSVPVSAVMDTGTRQVVFAHLDDGTFEPRTVAVGLRLADRVEVLSGVVEGERVLAEGNFFIDAESRLKAALQGAAAAAGHAH